MCWKVIFRSWSWICICTLLEKKLKFCEWKNFFLPKKWPKPVFGTWKYSSKIFKNVTNQIRANYIFKFFLKTKVKKKLRQKESLDSLSNSSLWQHFRTSWCFYIFLFLFWWKEAYKGRRWDNDQVRINYNVNLIDISREYKITISLTNYVPLNSLNKRL